MTTRINSTIVKLMCVGALVAVLTAAVTMAAQKAEDAETLLQTARKKEVVDRDFAGAIETYKKAFAAARGNPATAAMSLVRLAELYQKTGDVQARKVYEQVVKEYPDQKEAVTMARAALERPSGMKSTLVWSPFPGWPRGVSPDGRNMLVNVGPDLFLRDFDANIDRRIDFRIAGDASFQFASFGNALISRNGKQVVFDWIGSNQGAESKCELRVANITGDANPRRVYSYPSDITNAYVFDWAPDGKTVIVQVKRRDGTWQLALISVDGSFRVLKSLEWKQAGLALFSPDGRWVGFDQPNPADPTSRDVFVLAVDGSREIPAVTHRANDSMIGWSPDGNWLLFSSDRSGRKDLWTVPFRSVGSVGSAQLLKAGFDGFPLGVTRSGTLYYAESSTGGNSRIGLASIDINAGLVTPTEFSQPIQHSNRNPIWSPDGENLAYLSERPEGTVLVIRSNQTNPSRDFKPDLHLQDLKSWVPDGHSLLVTGRDSKGRSGIHLVDAKSGAVKAVAPTAGRGLSVALTRWAPDGRSLVFGLNRLYRLDLESGEVSQMPYPAEPIADLRRAQYSPDGSRLYRAAENDLVEMDLSSGADTKLKVEVAGQSLNSLALSHVMPDGRNLLVSGTDPVSRDRVLRLIPLPSGEPRDLMRVPQPLLKPDGSGVKHTLSPLSLVPDSRAVLVARETRSPGRVEADLWLVPLGGGEPKRIGGLGDTSDSLSITVSPDGRHLAYVLTDGVGPSPTKVWALENFLPKPATK